MLSKPIANTLHLLLVVAQASAVAALIQLDILVLALAVAVIGKWRVMSFSPYRFWRNLRSNSCDLIVLISLVLIMDFYIAKIALFGGFTLFMLLWLLVIKPGTSSTMVKFQAFCCQFIGLSALWLVVVENGVLGIIALPLSGIITYSAARHGLTAVADDTQERSVLPIIWSMVMLQLSWLAWLWSITYSIPGGVLVPQIAVLSSVFGYFAIQNVDAASGQGKRRLSPAIIWQQAFFFAVALVAIVALTPWSTR